MLFRRSNSGPISVLLGVFFMVVAGNRAWKDRIQEDVKKVQEGLGRRSMKSLHRGSESELEQRGRKIQGTSNARLARLLSS